MSHNKQTTKLNFRHPQAVDLNKVQEELNENTDEDVFADSIEEFFSSNKKRKKPTKTIELRKN